jgi:hypothetical protein
MNFNFRYLVHSSWGKGCRLISASASGKVTAIAVTADLGYRVLGCGLFIRVFKV